ncbi:MAG: DUF1513 domain-containing protein [Hyphomicrobiaceae bacterium]
MRRAFQSASTNSMAIDRRTILLGSLSAISLVRFSGGTALGGQNTEAAFVSAARMPDQSYAILLLAADGSVLRQVPLSGRGHDIAHHHESGRAVAFARRPGTFAVAFDVAGSHEPAVFNAIEGRHFYGHGAFSANGKLLYTSENDIAAGRGVVGIYDVEADYKRIGEHQSHGVGPHEIILLADGRTLAIANGGIDTVPEAGRAMLNVDEMRPNLAFADSESGAMLARHELSVDLNRLSIRHIAADGNGAVWFGGQWEGDVAETPELVGRATPDSAIRMIKPASSLGVELKGYIGSVSATVDGSVIAASAPKAGRILYVNTADGSIAGNSELPDGCGVAGEEHARFCVTSGLGKFRHETPGARVLSERVLEGIAFDNHLRRL